MPRSLAASTRPWPAMICFSSSTRIGLQNPNFWMLFAICRICFLECVRALFGYGRNSPTGITSIFMQLVLSVQVASAAHWSGLADLLVHGRIAERDRPPDPDALALGGSDLVPHPLPDQLHS